MKPLIMICAWCAGSAQRTAAARDAGFDVSHGICEDCQTEFYRDSELVPLDEYPIVTIAPRAQRGKQ